MRLEGADMQLPEQAGRIFDLSKKVIVQLDEFKLYVMLDDHLGQGISTTKKYEPNVTSAMRPSIKPGDTFLDIGANIGYFTMMAAFVVGAAGKVIAVEPNPQNVQLICESAKANGLTNVSVYPLAASDRTAILEFFNHGSNGGVITETMRRTAEPLWVELTNCHFFSQSVLLDDMLSTLDRLDVVKIDIEAHEPEALRGMTGLISKHRPIIFTEFHPWALSRMSEAPPDDYLRQVISLGYSFSILDRDGSVVHAVTPDDIMTRWRAQEDGKIHFDLCATPLS
jgi:FkbM family methyltransferase